MTPTPSISDASAWAIWFAAANRKGIDDAIRAVYSELSQAVAARGPVCWASGRCCNFEKFGHRLYVTALETAWCVREISRAQPPLRALLSRPVEPRGGCPFQVDSLCHAHTMRPLGCRVFFCERGTQDWQHALYEQFQSRLKSLHDSENIPYVYAEWRASLHHAIEFQRSSESNSEG